MSVVCAGGCRTAQPTATGSCFPAASVSGSRERPPGHHIFRPSATLALVTRYVRTRKVSSSTPTEMTKPSSTSWRSPMFVSTAKVAARTR